MSEQIQTTESDIGGELNFWEKIQLQITCLTSEIPSGVHELMMQIQKLGGFPHFPEDSSTIEREDPDSYWDRVMECMENQLLKLRGQENREIN